MMKKITLLTMLLVFMNLQAQLDNYVFQETSGNTYGSLTGMTVLYSGSDYDDEETPNIPIGFDFKFGGQTYNTLTIGVNGAISFTETNIFNTNELQSTSANKINMVAPFWDDLKLFAADNGEISYKTYGTAPNRGFVVEWKNIRRYSQTGTMTFSLYLKETTNYIKFLYDTCTASTTNASIGFNSNTGSGTTYVSLNPDATTSTVSTTYAYNQIASTDFPAGKLYTFSPRPSNDFRFEPLAISVDPYNSACSTINLAYNTGATDSGGNIPSVANYAGGDVWFMFTAPAYGAVEFVRHNRGDWDGLGFAVYPASANGNDPSVYETMVTYPEVGDSFKVFNLVPGEQYRLRLWEYGNNDLGYVQFCLNELKNDANSKAFDIDVQAENASSYVETYANNNGATASPNAAPACGNYNGGDVWFKFIAPANGQVAVEHSDIAGDWSSLAFAVYSSAGSSTALFCDFIPISGHSAPYDTKLITGLTAGTEYWLRAWDYGNDNFGVSPFHLREDSTNDIEDYAALDFKYYPNPTSNIININAKNNIETISITNLMGQEVIKVQPSATQTRVNLSSLHSGIYLMRVQMGDLIKTVKVIKK